MPVNPYLKFLNSLFCPRTQHQGADSATRRCSLQMDVALARYHTMGGRLQITKVALLYWRLIVTKQTAS